MNITELGIIGWEPAIITFTFAKRRSFNAKRFTQYTDSFLRNGRSGLCNCKLNYLKFLERSGGAIEMHVEWVCRACLQILANVVKAEFPQLLDVTLGVEATLPQTAAKGIRVERRTVELENGRKVAVGPFTIGKYPVNVSQFQRFVDATGYVTTAQRRNDVESFSNNGFVSGLPKTERASSPVACVSALDAKAYCDFTGCRLPTEAEWFAAAVKDTEELDIDGSEELQRRLNGAPPGVIVSDGWDITATSDGEERVVARRGPLHFLKKGWRDAEQIKAHRRSIRLEEYDLMLMFRTIND